MGAELCKKYLDMWMKQILVKEGFCREQEEINRDMIFNYQMKHLRETIRYAFDHSIFYRKKYLDILKQDDIPMLLMEDFRSLPYMSAEDLINDGDQMVCSHMKDIERVVSLKTSGSTGFPKRIYFTGEDLKLTKDFFREGMKFLTAPNDLAYIGMPHNVPQSIGRLLKEALDESGVRSTYDIKTPGIQCIVGIPDEILKMAVSQDYSFLKRSVKTVLLSADYVSDECKAKIQDLWDCQVFEHYGMTEMGLGCAVSCGMGKGYHIRENDLFIEIIHPLTEKEVDPGETGEIVFTTLTRTGMPLIRYRTGDYSTWISEPCECKSILKKMDKVQCRNAKKAMKHVFE